MLVAIIFIVLQKVRSSSYNESKVSSFSIISLTATPLLVALD